MQTMDNLLTIQYKEKAFTLKELMEDNNQFSKVLKFPKKRPHGSMSLVYDKGYAIADHKLDHLEKLISSGRFALTQAHRKLHKSPIEWSSGYVGQLWLRANYLNNAIVWYNSMIDYILQAVWFAFDFYSPITNAEDYEKELKKYLWQTISEIYKKHTSNENFTILYQRLLSYKSNTSVKTVNNWANTLKHKGTINYQELHVDRGIEIIFKDKFTYSTLDKDRVDLDYACEVLKDVHIELVGITNFLIDFMDVEGFLNKDENGVYHPMSQPKSAYKKFWIND